MVNGPRWLDGSVKPEQTFEESYINNPEMEKKLFKGKKFKQQQHMDGSIPCHASFNWNTLGFYNDGPELDFAKKTFCFDYKIVFAKHLSSLRESILNIQFSQSIIKLKFTL